MKIQVWSPGSITPPQQVFLFSRSQDLPFYLPQMSPGSHIPFPTLNITPVNLSGPESDESYSAELDPEENSRHLKNKAQTLSGSIRYLMEQLMEVRGKIQEALHPRTTPESSNSDQRIHDFEESHHCTSNHKFQECLKKRTWDEEEGSIHHVSRRSRRWERARRRKGIWRNKGARTDEDEAVVEAERDSSQEGGEESGRVMDKAQQRLNHVRENPMLTVKKPYINQAQLEALYSDDMPNVTIHLTTPELLETTQGPSQGPNGETILPFERDPINSMNISQLLDHMRNTQAKLLNEVSRHSVTTQTVWLTIGTLCAFRPQTQCRH